MLILYELQFNYNSIMDSFNLNCNYSDINYDTIARNTQNHVWDFTCWSPQLSVCTCHCLFNDSHWL